MAEIDEMIACTLLTTQMKAIEEMWRSLIDEYGKERLRHNTRFTKAAQGISATNRALANLFSGYVEAKEVLHG